MEPPPRLGPQQKLQGGWPCPGGPGNTPGSWPRHNRALRVSARSLLQEERVWGPSHLQEHLEKTLHPRTCPEGLGEWTGTCVRVCMGPPLQEEACGPQVRTTTTLDTWDQEASPGPPWPLSSH